MADTKVKAAPKQSTATNGAAAKGKGRTVATRRQPDSVMPGTDQPTAAASGRALPKTKVAAPTFPKETYMQWYEQMQLMRKFEDKAGQL